MTGPRVSLAERREKQIKTLEFQLIGCIDTKSKRVLLGDPINLSQFSVEKYHELADYKVDNEMRSNQVMLHSDSGTGCILEVPQGVCIPVYGKIENGRLREVRLVL